MTVGSGETVRPRPARVLPRQHFEGLRTEQLSLLRRPEERRRVEVPHRTVQRKVPQEVSASRSLGHPAGHAPDRPAHGAGHDLVAPLPPFHEVLVVAREQLVPAVSREDHGDELRGQPRDDVGRDGRGVAERLVQEPRQVVHDVHHVGRHDQLVVLRAVSLCDQAGVAQLVVILLVEADRERLHGSGRQARHGRDHGARVDAAAQEGPQGHVAGQVEADRFREQLPQPLHEGLLVLAFVGLETHVPVRLDPYPPARGSDQDVPGLELAHALHDALRGGSAQESEQVIDRAPVQAPFHVGELQDCLQLRGEDQPAAGHGVVQGLDAHPVAREQQFPAAFVPQGHREHAAHPLHASPAELFVEMHDGFRVGPAAEGVTAPLQIVAQFFEVVDLAIAHGPDRAVLVAQGLAPPRRVDDAQAAHPQGRAAAGVETLVVRAAVDHHAAHRSDLPRIDGAVVEAHNSGDAAHLVYLCASRSATSPSRSREERSPPARTRNVPA